MFIMGTIINYFNKNMNLLDCTVTEILKPTYEAYDKWFTEVEYTCYGTKGKTLIMSFTKEHAETVEVGYVFLQ